MKTWPKWKYKLEYVCLRCHTIYGSDKFILNMHYCPRCMEAGVTSKISSEYLRWISTSKWWPLKDWFSGYWLNKNDGKFYHRSW